MPYVIFNYIIMLRVFRSSHHCYWKFHKFHRKAPLLETLFFLKTMKLYKEFVLHEQLYFLPYFCRNIFPIDWRHKRLKNTADLLIFYGEHFYGFSESDLWKRWKKKHSLHNEHIYIYDHRHFEDLWSYFVHIVKACFVFKKQWLCLYFSVYE